MQLAAGAGRSVHALYPFLLAGRGNPRRDVATATSRESEMSTAVDKEGAALTVTRYDALAGLPFTAGYLAAKDTQMLLDELFFQRAVQTYIWAQPALNMYGMKEGSEKVFGKGYNILPIFKKRLDAQDTHHHP